MNPRSMALLAAALLLGACETDQPQDDDGAPMCVERDASACDPLYEPTWERVFTQTIQPSCGTAGIACHAQSDASGSRGGFVVTDMAATHAAIVDSGFVVPGDEACSDLMYRLDTEDTSVLMPPGSQPLGEAERCAVAQWIAQGAQP
ncbi:MAG: c-type cytochrome domain-containing protein [Nannocystaceae bacterium]